MYYFLHQFTNPYVVLMLLLGVCLFRGMRGDAYFRRRWQSALLIWLALYTLSLHAVGALLVDTLESRVTVDETALHAPDAIVVLGAGVEILDDEAENVRLTVNGVDRCVHAFNRYRKNGPCPLILCGGIVDSDREYPSEAEVMRDFLETLGVPKDGMILEDRSRSTFENIRNAAELMLRHQFDRVVCVTSARHMHRVMLCCQKAGAGMAPDPCGFQEPVRNVKWYEHALPYTGAIEKSRTAIHEWIGIAWYRANGRI